MSRSFGCLIVFDGNASLCVSGALSFFFGLENVSFGLGSDQWFLLGQGTGMTIAALIIGYVSTLILFSLGMLLEVVENAAGVFGQVQEMKAGGTWEGRIKNVEAFGESIMTMPDGTVWKGRFENGQANGPGVMTYQDGSELRGVWKDGGKVE